MTSLRVAIGVLATILAFALTPPAHAQPCQPAWDIRFGQPGADDEVTDSVVFDDGTGPALFICGKFVSVGGVHARGIAKWDGRHWSEVGGGLTGFNQSPAWVGTLLVWDDGRGPALYAGGQFTYAGGVPASTIARWDGHQWEALGSGTDGGVYSLGVFDDGRGSALYAGGRFQRAGQVMYANNMARWDGANWEALGDGVTGRSYFAYCMAVFDDGQGPALYIGGDAWVWNHGQPIRYLLRWDGHQWSQPKGVDLSGIPYGYVPYIEGLKVYDDGTGPALFIAGPIQQEGVGRDFLKWDGQTVTSPQGFFPSSDPPLAMQTFDDGSGPALWIGGGRFAVNARNGYTSIAKWDGRTWTAPASYPYQWIVTLTPFNDGFGNALFVGGRLFWFEPDHANPMGHFTRFTTPHMALDHSPLRAGEPAQFTTTCSTPGQRVNFVYSTRGLGSYYVQQLGISLDLNHPQLAGHAVADANGHAQLVRTVPPESSGRTLYLQAAERGRKTEVVVSTIE